MLANINGKIYVAFLTNIPHTPQNASPIVPLACATLFLHVDQQQALDSRGSPCCCDDIVYSVQLRDLQLLEDQELG